MKIAPIRKATDKEKQTIAKWTIGVTELDLKGARAYFPVQSVEKIIAHRESVYNAVSNEFHKERAIKMIPTTDKDLKLLRTRWLNSELAEIDRLCKIPRISDSETIELGKYRDYINTKLEKTGLSSKSYKSLRRVYAFIYVKALNEGKVKIWPNHKANFMNYCKGKFKDVSAQTLYKTLVCGYKDEPPIYTTTEMADYYTEDYNYAMEIYKNLYP